MKSALELLRSHDLELEHMSDTAKPESEVSAWTTEEDLTEEAKCELFLKSGFSLQKIWVMQNLHFISNNKSLIIHVFKNIVNWSEEIQLEFGTGLLSLVEKDQLSEDLKLDSIELSLTFLSFYSRTLHQRWLPIFSILLPMIPINTIKSKLIPEIMLLSDFSQKPITRQVSCHLLSNLAQVITKDFKGPLLQRAKSLSQDSDHEVREEMSKVWVDIISSLGKTVLEETLYFDIQKLIEDEVESVKCGGIKVLISVLSLFSESFFKKEVANTLASQVFSNTNLRVEEIICQSFPLLVSGTQTMKSETLLLLKRFIVKEVEYRKIVAFCYPGIIQIHGLTDGLKEIGLQLSQDFSLPVRETLAAGYHEVLSKNTTCKVLKKIASKLIEDLETRLVAFMKLDQWSTLLDPTQILIKFIKALTIQLDWRTQVKLLKAFQKAFKNFNLKDVLDHLVPLLLHKMLTASWPIKIAAAETVVNILHETYYIGRKFDLCNVVKEKFARSKCSFDRVLFLYFCEKVSHFASKKYFCRQFLEDFLNLAADPVQNVRIQFFKSLVEVALNTGCEVFLKKLRELEISEPYLNKFKESAISVLSSKSFESRHLEFSSKDRQKEIFESHQDQLEFKEAIRYKKTSDELMLKLEPDLKKKLPLRGKYQSESIGPKSRGSQSTASIKPVNKKK